jgi:hypothetical protein
MFGKGQFVPPPAVVAIPGLPIEMPGGPMPGPMLGPMLGPMPTSPPPSSGGSGIILVMLLAGVGAGAYFYMKSKKKKANKPAVKSELTKMEATPKFRKLFR